MGLVPPGRERCWAARAWGRRCCLQCFRELIPQIRVTSAKGRGPVKGLTLIRWSTSLLSLKRGYKHVKTGLKSRTVWMESGSGKVGGYL